MTSEEVARLTSLGYIGGTSISPTGSRPDPKDCIDIINRLKDVDRLLESGKVDEALTLAEEAMAQCEGNFTAHKVAEIYAKANRLPEACRVLREYAERHLPLRRFCLIWLSIIIVSGNLT